MGKPEGMSEGGRKEARTRVGIEIKEEGMKGQKKGNEGEKRKE